MLKGSPPRTFFTACWPSNEASRSNTSEALSNTWYNNCCSFFAPRVSTSGGGPEDVGGGACAAGGFARSSASSFSKARILANSSSLSLLLWSRSRCSSWFRAESIFISSLLSSPSGTSGASKFPFFGFIASMSLLRKSSISCSFCFACASSVASFPFSSFMASAMRRCNSSSEYFPPILSLPPRGELGADTGGVCMPTELTRVRRAPCGVSALDSWTATWPPSCWPPMRLRISSMRRLRSSASALYMSRSCSMSANKAFNRRISASSSASTLDTPSGRSPKGSLPLTNFEGSRDKMRRTLASTTSMRISRMSRSNDMSGSKSSWSICSSSSSEAFQFNVSSLAMEPMPMPSWIWRMTSCCEGACMSDMS
mmetsp:Transcript_58414/g.169424  ORF Transcript_58414/g.169424 Transcript_58414/m.169424 type:complete len:369 (-) Transcript_58414:817-1923(-)